MTTELGTELGTTLGTTLGAMEDIGPIPVPVFDTSKMYAVGGFSSANRYATPTGGGETGTGTGFGVLTVVRARALPSTTEVIRRKLGSTDGWQQVGLSSSRLNSNISNGTSAAGGALATLTSSDVGRILVLLTRITATPGVYETFLYRGLVAAGAAHAGYTPAAGGTAESIGAISDGSTPGPSFDVIGTLDFRGAPTLAEVQALYDLIRASGDVPSKVAAEAVMPGTTITHRRSVRDALLVANLPVADGAAAPASIPDAATNAPVDAMAKVGTPVVRVVDPAAYPRTSYGVQGFATTDYLKTSGASASLQGATTGQWFAYYFRPNVLLSATPEYLFGNTTASVGGYAVDLFSTGFRLLVPGVANSSPAAPIVASEVGTPMLAVYNFDGTTHSVWLRRAIGPSLAASYMVPTANELSIGARSTATSPSPSVDWRGAACGTVAGGLTSGEILSLFDRVEQTGRIQSVPGKTQHLWDPTQDVVAASTPTTVLDRIGTDHLTRVGTGLVLSPRTERLYSYDATPILYGADCPVGSYYNSTFNDPSMANQSFWFAALTHIVAATQASHVIIGARVGNAGFDFRTGTNNTTLMWYMGDGSAFNASGNVVTVPGKLNLAVCVWDQAALRQRIYGARAEVGAGTARTAYAPANVPIGYGWSSANNTSAGLNHPLMGFAMGLGAPTLAQVQALFDSVQANESMQPIAGMTSVLVDYTQDARAAGGALPSSLANRAGAGSFTVTGTPTLAPQYARAWAW